MSRWKRCGVVVDLYRHDHDPRHVHVYEDGHRAVRFDIERWVVLDGQISVKARRALDILREEGVFDEESEVSGDST